jgi:hypothetical protein
MKNEGRVIIVDTDDRLAASRLLHPELHALFSSALGSTFYGGIPGRDTLVLSSDRKALKAVCRTDAGCANAPGYFGRLHRRAQGSGPFIRTESDCTPGMTANSRGTESADRQCPFSSDCQILRHDARSAAISHQARRVGLRGVNWPTRAK